MAAFFAAIQVGTSSLGLSEILTVENAHGEL